MYTDTPLVSRSVAQALWLIGKGYQPLRATEGTEGKGIVVTFSPAAHEIIEQYYEDKNQLWELVHRGAR